MTKVRFSSKKSLFIIAGCVATVAVVTGFLLAPTKLSTSSRAEAFNEF